MRHPKTVAQPQATDKREKQRCGALVKQGGMSFCDLLSMSLLLSEVQQMAAAVVPEMCGREPIEFGSTGPLAIAVNKRGNIVVTDSQIIKVFSSDGALSHNFLPVYSKKDTRPEISALTLDREGNILAADRPNHRIQKFRIDGHFLGFIGGSMYLQYPSGLAITKNNDVIISECESHQLKIFHEHGKSFTVVGRSGVGKNQLMNPRGLAVDHVGNILVADSLNHRIQVIDSQGNFIGNFGRLGSGPGCLDTPYAVAVNRRGHVIVADSGNHRITCFT